jgi:hypothetical protein
MQYTRLYPDADGNSHLEDIDLPLTPANFSPPAPPINATPFLPATQYGFISASPGWYGDWHPAPRRQLMCYLAGEVEAETSDGAVRRFGPGDITLLEDTTGKGHRSRVIGDVDVLFIVVQLPDTQ